MIYDTTSAPLNGSEHHRGYRCEFHENKYRLELDGTGLEIARSYEIERCRDAAWEIIGSYPIRRGEVQKMVQSKDLKNLEGLVFQLGIAVSEIHRDCESDLNSNYRENILSFCTDIEPVADAKLSRYIHEITKRLS